MEQKNLEDDLAGTKLADSLAPSVRILERATALVDALSEAGDRGLNLAELVERTQLSKTTTHRLAHALTAVGWLYSDADSKTFHLGVRLAGRGAHAWQYLAALLARPTLMALAEETGDTVFLSVREGSGAVCVARHEGGFPIRTLTLNLYDRRPLGVGAGALALLAWAPPAWRERYLEINEQWIASYPRISIPLVRELMANARTNGYAINDGGIIDSMIGIAVPILNEQQEVIAALSIAAISSRLDEKRRLQLVPDMQARAAVLAGQFSARFASLPIN